MKRNERSESDRAVGSISGRSYWIPGSYTPSIVREAKVLFKAIEKEGLQGGKGDNNWVVCHRQIPRPWNPTRASWDCRPLLDYRNYFCSILQKKGLRREGAAEG